MSLPKEAGKQIGIDSPEEVIDIPLNLEQKIERRLEDKKRKPVYEAIAAAIVLDFYGLPLDQREKIRYYLWELRGNFSLINSHLEDASSFEKAEVINPVLIDSDLYKGYLQMEKTLQIANRYVGSVGDTNLRVSRLREQLVYLKQN